MQCIHCKGEMKRGKAPFHIDRRYHLMFDAVPAWVCSQCGEVYFEEAEVDSIQGALKTLDEKTE
ncbi:MAG: YgiT-type zinc finger protein [Chloroflexi bacterium]|nr:YgiT-type zinc finger protein [Chloroflexota bacterium]